jgi:hypothetical protein
MHALLAWIWIPLASLAVFVGLGSLAGRVVRAACPPSVLPGVGLAVAIAVTELTYRLGLTVPVVLPLLVVLAIAGGVLGRDHLRTLRPGAPAAAGLITYLLYLAPVALSGHPTWAGNNFTNDPSLLFTGADWVLQHGYHVPAANDSTSLITAGAVVGQGYPIGSHLVLGTLAKLGGLGFAEATQPFIALLGGLGSAAACLLLFRTGMPRWAAALGAVTASGASLLYAYAQLGGMKEVATVATLLTAAALGDEALRRQLRPGMIALTAVVLASLGGIFSLGGFAYAGIFALALLIAALVARVTTARRVLVGAGAGTVAFLVAGGSVLSDAVSFGQTAADQFGGSFSTGVFGQLLRPLPLTQIGGVWLGDDWRAAVVQPFRADVTSVLDVVALGLAAVGVAWALWRRRASLVPVLGTAVVVAAVIAPRTTPYGDSKLLIVLTPFVLLASAIGVWAIAQLRPRVVALGAGAIAAALVAGVFFTDAIIYRQARLAPLDRMEAIEDVADAARGKGMVLFNEWEEYAKFFARAAQVNVPGEVVGPKPFVLRQPGPTFAQHFDLDELQLDYVLSFPAIITRRGPATSRPPANYRSVHRNRYYELWVRDAAVRVVDHLPLQGASTASRKPLCWELERFARSAAPGEEIVAHRFPPTESLNPAAARDRSFGWGVIDLTTVLPATPGHASQRVRVPRSGRYAVWVRGTSGRAVDALVDGKVVGQLKQVNTPEQWVNVANVDLATGTHVLELRRPGGSFGPGNAYRGELGPMTLVPEAGAAGELIRIAPGDVSRYCDQNLDWVERVRER